MKQVSAVVNCQWLAQQLNTPQLIIIDCRFKLSDPQWGEAQYLQRHIPGAYYLDLDRDLSSSVRLHGGRHPLPDVERLATKLAAMGIVRNQTMVVVYDDSRFAFAARAWWLLRYLGHQPVAVLDGGWQGWLKADYPTSNSIPELSSGDFTPDPQTNWIVNRATVKARTGLPGTILVDSRDRDRYAGEREPIDPIAGSIPGAVNSPWKQVSDEAGYLQRIEVQRQLWSSYSQAAEIMVYCGSGVTACVNLLSLHLVGIDRAQLYPGGWSDWCSYL